jgi:DNA-binding beta-propeller fold protein YncE
MYFRKLFALTLTTVLVFCLFLSDDIYADAVDNYVWVSSGNANRIYRVDKSNSSYLEIDVGNQPEGVAVDDAYIWVVNIDDDNLKFDSCRQILRSFYL